ncbi:MAG: S24 family peptidase [Sphingobium sp.]
MSALDIHALTHYAGGMKQPLSVKIRNLRQRLNKNQTEFGRIFDVQQATVSRWETGSVPEHQHLLKMAELIGEDFATFVGNNDIGEQFSAARLGPSLRVVADVEAGVFKDAWQWEPDEWVEFTGIGNSNAPAKDRYGLRVRGESMNLIYPPGTIIECQTVWGSTPIPSGKRVIVQRRRFNDGVETTCKEYVEDENGVGWLVPRSSNPSFQAFRCDEPGEGIEEVKIIAIVVASIRPE